MQTPCRFVGVATPDAELQRSEHSPDMFGNHCTQLIGCPPNKHTKSLCAFRALSRVAPDNSLRCQVHAHNVRAFGSGAGCRTTRQGFALRAPVCYLLACIRNKPTLTNQRLLG
jgi:hypothetical protein